MWHLLYISVILCGRRGVQRMADAFCASGVAFAACQARSVWQTWLVILVWCFLYAGDLLGWWFVVRVFFVVVGGDFVLLCW